MRFAKACLLLVLCGAGEGHAEKLRLEQVLQAVVDHYPSLKTASYQVEKAHQEAQIVKSQLGWQLNGQGGIANDVSFIGTTVQRIDMNGGVRRSLESGGDVSLNGSIVRDDLSGSSSPLTTSRLDLSYRRPLDKGAGNPEYSLQLELANNNVVLANSEKRIVYDNLATRVVDLYFEAAVTLSRIQNINLSLKRTRRLEKFIKSRLSLGIAENKDQLQVVAQFHSQKAQLTVLELAWVQQLVSLNRLMGREWDKPLDVDYSAGAGQKLLDDLSALIKSVKENSPRLAQINTQLKSIRNKVRLQQEERKDKMDIVMYLGNQTSEGSGPFGEQDSSELVGGVRLEYETGLDKTGLDASVYQAQLDMAILQQNQKQVHEDLDYDTATLVAQIKTVRQSLMAYEISVSSERKKLDDAETRYRKGRIDIDRVIQFENQLSAAELNLSIQRIELKRRLAKLDLLSGHVWRNVTLPKLDLSMRPEYE